MASLAGGLVHEIRNPLSSMSLNLELLIEDFDGSEEPRDKRALKKLQTVFRECQNLERILNDFLQFARVGRVERESVNLNETIREFIEFFQPQASERRVELSPHLALDLPNVLLDRNLWRQALLNLCRNAVEVMTDGGVIEFQTQHQDGTVVLELIDNGAGMDGPTQERIFEVFYSTKSGGSGLGLPTVQRIIRAHGGEILCDSEPGRGTRFTIRLPAAG